MSSSSSDSGTSLKSWALGIIGAVLTSVLIFVITQRLGAPKPNPEPTIVSVNGRVFDGAAKRLLENVVVRLQISSLNEEQKTDSLGRYAFSLVGFDTRLSGSMHIEAPGYKPLNYNLSLQQMSDMQDLYLEALGPAAPSEVGATVDSPVVTSHVPPSRYVARVDPRRIYAQNH